MRIQVSTVMNGHPDDFDGSPHSILVLAEDILFNCYT